MKKIVLLVTAIVVLSGFASQEKKKIIFFGDSITEAGVNEWNVYLPKSTTWKKAI